MNESESLSSKSGHSLQFQFSTYLLLLFYSRPADACYSRSTPRSKSVTLLNVIFRVAGLMLLAAEQDAQRIVNAARAAKMARLKQAKEEAEKDIAEFRAQMEAQYQRKVSESSGDSGANVKRLEVETEGKIHHLKTEARRISQDVVQMLLRQVTTVKN
ncbi:hypothetical protein Vadar_014302 [Vaccinium darrowii]|uniref:Uncharacterized protein n=1 Tax=Vaccinium darrowii TaxID=229202 RepID=A0ACB7YV53_9ERIC|nr:hypothetical protein Vadar_014302 [Vaccinium darrowii]